MLRKCRGLVAWSKKMVVIQTPSDYGPGYKCTNMRFFFLLTLLIAVVVFSTNVQGKRQKKEGCLLNNKIYKEGKTVYKDRSHCLKLRCVKRTSKKGKVKYMLKPRTYRNCQCFPILCRGPRCTPPEPCPKCSNVWEPVCGSNNITYTNECQFFGKTEPCGRDKAKLVLYGECGKCPVGCPKNIDRVCGSDGKTYDNECVMILAGCETNTTLTVAYEGNCIVPMNTTGIKNASCDKCTKIRRPVCGSDGITYSNQCLLDAAVCKGKSVTTVHKGACKGDPEIKETMDTTAKKGRTCKYNGKKYNMGEMITDMVEYCLTVACQPSVRVSKPTVVFQAFQGANSCECTSSPMRKKILRLTKL